MSIKHISYLNVISAMKNKKQKRALKSLGWEGLKFYRGCHGRPFMKVIFEQEVKNIRAKTCRYLEK